MRWNSAWIGFEIETWASSWRGEGALTAVSTRTVSVSARGAIGVAVGTSAAIGRGVDADLGGATAKAIAGSIGGGAMTVAPAGTTPSDFDFLPSFGFGGICRIAGMCEDRTSERRGVQASVGLGNDPTRFGRSTATPAANSLTAASR